MSFFSTDPFTLLARVIVLLTAIPVHEAAHAYVADRLGDPTARYAGRLTLNPFAHYNLWGTLSLLAFGIGWAEPVPINPMNFDDRKKGMAISAAAGPTSNLIMALFSMIISKMIYWVHFISNLSYGSLWGKVLSWRYIIFSYMCQINISLAIFNMLPFPPFDGSRIYSLFLSDRRYFKIMEYEKYIFMIVFALVFTGLLDAPLAFLNGCVYKLLDALTFFVDKFFYLVL